jgi:hypothetical protein
MSRATSDEEHANDERLDQDATTTFSWCAKIRFLSHQFIKPYCDYNTSTTARTRMVDYTKYPTVEAVEAYVNSVPLAIKRLLDVPWRGGGRSFRIDKERLQLILDSLPNRSSTNNNTITISNSNQSTSSTSRVEPETRSDEGHILIPFSRMKQWIASSMCCRHCRCDVKANYISKTTIGIATEMFFKCGSDSCSNSGTTTKMQAETVIADNDEVRPSVSRVGSSVARFGANWRLLAATQLFGESQKAGEIVASYLDLAPSAFRDSWFRMENSLAVHHEKVTKQIIRQNLLVALSNKTTDENGKKPLTVSFDMGWQKRGLSFNSLSGHAFLIDVETGKVVGKRVYSKKCRKCSAFIEKGLSASDIPTHNCTKNYDGSSKGMEATAALEMVKEIFDNENIQAFVSEMVLDDDASTRALLSHCLSELLQKVKDYEWPLDSNGKKIPKTKDVGKLPFDHPIILFLADLTHRIRCFGKYVFGLAYSPVSASTCTMVDAYRLKRNFAYWLMCYHKESFEIFQEKAKAVVEHHFNDHSYCDASWCSMKKGSDEKTATGNLKYRCKDKYKLLYKQVSDVMDRFITTKKLKECHHGHSSQKNESMNRLVSRYIPKDRTYSQSMSMASRVCLAVGVDSVGHWEYYERLFAETSVKLPLHTRIMLERMSKRREYDRNYQRRPERKRKRSNLKFAKMKDGLKTQMADKAMGLNYQTGLCMEEIGDDPDAGGPNTKQKPARCKFCGSSQHKTRRSKGCKFFGWSNELVEAEMVRVNILRATTGRVGEATSKVSSEVQSDGTCYFFFISCDTHHTGIIWN